MVSVAVVVIDVQNAILGVPGLMRPVETYAAFDAVVARIATLIEHARKLSTPVLFVQHDEKPGHRLKRGSLGWQI